MSTQSQHDPEFTGAIPKHRPARRFSILRVFAALGGILLLIALMLPAVRTAGPAARRAQCVNNLKQIALALHNYHQDFQALPPAYTVDESGRPLHSWRTLILPYLEQKRLYETIDFSKPWNDPANAKALATGVPEFRCTESTGPENTTTYLGIVAPNSCFSPTEPRSFDAITDGTGSTIMVIEAGESSAVPWMAPLDADESLVLTFGPESKLHHNGGTNAAFADGSVRFLKSTLSLKPRRALITISGNEKISQDEY